jgi:hypothetical protein
MDAGNTDTTFAEGRRGVRSARLLILSDPQV